MSERTRFATFSTLLHFPCQRGLRPADRPSGCSLFNGNSTFVTV